MGINGIENLIQDDKVKIGDIQVDSNKSEWVIVGVTHTGVSRVKRNSMAHLVHAKDSSEIAKSLHSDLRERYL